MGLQQHNKVKATKSPRKENSSSEYSKSSVTFEELNADWQYLINLAEEGLSSIQSNNEVNSLKDDLKTPSELLKRLIVEVKLELNDRKSDIEDVELEEEENLSKMNEKSFEYWNRLANSNYTKPFSMRTPSKRHGFLSSYAKRYSIKRYLDRNPGDQDCIRRKLLFVNSARRPKSISEEISSTNSTKKRQSYIDDIATMEELQSITDESLRKLRERKNKMSQEELEARENLLRNLSNRMKTSSERIIPRSNTLLPIDGKWLDRESKSEVHSSNSELQFKTPSVIKRIEQVKTKVREMRSSRPALENSATKNILDKPLDVSSISFHFRSKLKHKEAKF
jgi:hypothetical protein